MRLRTPYRNTQVEVNTQQIKMKVTRQAYCDVLYISLIISAIVSTCLSAPLDSFYPGEETELVNPQRLQLLKELRDMIELEERNKQEELGQTDNSVPTGLMRVMPQKRFRPFRTQTRGGSGVALCLWKVCPAAPWLVSKRR
ncbi:hypothetical protein ACF0H5_019166 [Mactra antiquata]